MPYKSISSIQFHPIADNNGGTPKSSKSLDPFGIQTHGDLGISHFKA